MVDEAGFAHALAHDGELREIDIFVAATWFLLEQHQERRMPFLEVCEFVEHLGVRANINRSRLRQSLVKRAGISRSGDDMVSLVLSEKSKLSAKYAQYMGDPKQKIQDTVLELCDFENSRIYIKSLASQLNACHQFGIYDGCAVLMRRLMEVLIIDAYENAGLREQILTNGDYMQLSGLIGVIGSGVNFKLSRNASKWMEQCKALGDNAAHSRTYITKKLDIEGFGQQYRSLIAELQSL